MGIDRGGGKPVRDDEGHLGRMMPPFLERLPGRSVETPAKIGPAQIGVPVRRRRAQPQGLAPQFTEFGDDPLRVEGGVDGILGAGVSQLKVEVMGGGQPGTGAPQTDPRWRGAPQGRPGNPAAGRHRNCSSSARAGRIEAGRRFEKRGSIKLPLLSANPIRSSHAANSGAGRLFRTRRK